MINVDDNQIVSVHGEANDILNQFAVVVSSLKLGLIKGYGKEIAEDLLSKAFMNGFSSEHKPKEIQHEEVITYH